MINYVFEIYLNYNENKLNEIIGEFSLDVNNKYYNIRNYGYDFLNEFI